MSNKETTEKKFPSDKFIPNLGKQLKCKNAIIWELFFNY